MAVADELVDTGRGDGHAELVVLDLAGDADLHRRSRSLNQGDNWGTAIHTRMHYGTSGQTTFERGSPSLMKDFPLSSLSKY
ncbi:hypothetical protein GCM10010275_61700 [Streptomyces litmocidini]|nr:hypothetical protein GCM10010275_61700 [Streptomyces litmocidini]